MPWIAPAPRTVRPSLSSTTSAPICCQDPAQGVAGLGRRGRPVRDRDAATAGQRQHQERGGVRQVGLDGDVSSRDRARQHPPPVRVGVVDLDASRAQAGDGHLDVRQGRHRLAVVAYVDALVEARRGEEQRGDELARRRRVDHHRAAAHAARARDDERQPVDVGDHGHTEGPRAQRGSPPSAGCARAGRRRTRSAPRRSAATGGTNRMTVPASPQSTAASGCRPAEIPGSTLQSSPLLSTAEPSAVSAAAMSPVSRDRSARRTTPGPSASAASTSSRLVSDFDPGSETLTSTGATACGAGQRSGRGGRITCAGYRGGAGPSRTASWLFDIVGSV